MSDAVRMPKLGLTMEHGVIIHWTRKEGDSIKRGDVLLEVESDKATVDVESDFEGTLLKRYYDAGAKVPCGDTIALIGNAGDRNPEFDGQSAAAGPEPAGESHRTVSLQKPGAVAESISTQKGKNIASPRAKRFARRHGVDLSGIMAGSGENNRIVELDVKNHFEAAANARMLKISPVARNIMESAGLSAQGLAGSGPDGRIMSEDVLRAVEERRNTTTAYPDSAIPKKVALTSMRATIARRLSESKRSIPHFYMSTSVNMETFINARNSHNAMHPDRKVSMNAMLMKIVAVALMKHPDVNASWTDDGIIYYPNADIALAVTTGTGLITPVVKNCNDKGVLAIDSELADLISRARNGSLKPQEYSASTCTLSNLGMYGIEEFSAIINPPEASILAIASIIDTPVALGQTVAIKPMMKITMSCDHRVIDGAVGAEFLKDVRLVLEQPFFGLF
jgi:pyruvate dehydrogenase E2 component (dihydrolipoamide acetyltransferase)